MWPRFFERVVRPFIAREFGAESAWGHLAVASVNVTVAIVAAEMDAGSRP